jgi:hypothetical protein
MVDTASKSRNIFKPIIAGVVLLAALILIVAFRSQLGDLISSSSKEGGSTIVSWIPDHKAATTVIAGAFVVFLGINWIAHIAGRVRAWLFVVVVEIGLWALFWNGVGIPPLKDLVGLDSVDRISAPAQTVSGALIMVLGGVAFWFLEAKESFEARRHRTGGDD